MKKIEFGYANDYKPGGSWQGLGIKEGLLLADAEYYGVVNYGRDSFIVAKVIEDKYGRYPQLLGNFIVRPAIADMYPDGSGILFLDQEQSSIGEQIEKYLNIAKSHINSYEDILKSCDFVQRGNRFFDLITDSDRIVATSIRHDVFEEKNNALKNCHATFSNSLISQNNLVNDSGITR